MDKANIPNHLAIIMDGNRRWAKEKGIDYRLGHKEGAKTLEKTVRYAKKVGIKYITVYAFSTENWKRSEEEVGALMLLLKTYLDDYSKRADSENIKVKVLGDITALIDDIDETIVANNLYTAGIPDPDLVIRTSGELRTSNFLPWQIVYSEFLFLDKYWPDFSEEDIDNAILVYQKRNRNFGAK